MRRLSFLIALLIPSIALCEGRAPRELNDGYYMEFSHKPSDKLKNLTYKKYLRFGSIGLIGFSRTSGTGDHDIRVGTGYPEYGLNRSDISGIVAEDTTGDSTPDVLIFASPDLSADTFYIEAWSADNGPGTWVIRHSEFNVPEQIVESLAWAGLQMIAECIFTGCDGASTAVQNNVGRALSLGTSLLTRNNVCSVGTDAIINEFSAELDRQIPDSRFVVLTLTNMMQNFVSEAAYVTCPF